MPRERDAWERALQKALKERARELDLLREHDLKAKASRHSS